jgi:glycosyltransferase involved in cell wall biosynthesis
MPEHVEHIRRRKKSKWLFYRLFTLPWIRHARAIHCTGTLEAQGVKKWLGNSVPIVIVPNGLDLPAMPGSIPPSIEDKLVLTYVGRISHEKGINTFLRAWLRVKRPDDKFRVAGAGSGRFEELYFKEFMKLVEEGKGSIEYVGYVSSSEVNRLIATSHFLVLPSGLDGDVRENFGNAVAEALALARPVIVTKGLEWDCTETWGAGLVFDRHIEAAAEVVRRASSLGMENWRRMSEMARRWAEQKLEIGATAEQVWKVVTGRA